MTHATATTVTSDLGNTVVLDGTLYSYASTAATEAGKCEGKIVSTDTLVASIAGRHYDSWTEFRAAIASAIEDDDVWVDED